MKIPSIFLKYPLWFRIVWIIVLIVEIYILFTLGIFCVALAFYKIKYSLTYTVIAFIIGVALLYLGVKFLFH
jgi:small neutral amino acid transporter SnatA (MarC family)